MCWKKILKLNRKRSRKKAYAKSIFKSRQNPTDKNAYHGWVLTCLQLSIRFVKKAVWFENPLRLNAVLCRFIASSNIQIAVSRTSLSPNKMVG